jgi:hypothetical protein
MNIEKGTVKSLDLDAVRQKFETWRKTRVRGTRIPKDLWQAAIDVCRSEDYPLHIVVKQLRLNQTDLKNHIQQTFPIVTKTPPPTFIEMTCETQPGFISECIVEMEDSSGSKMKMCFRGKTELDLLELGKSFWSKQV